MASVLKAITTLLSSLKKAPAANGMYIQCNLTYPDPTYPDYSRIRSFVWEPESDSLIRKFSYPDSEAPL